MFDNTLKTAGVVLTTLAFISCDSGAFLAPGEDGPNEINGVEVASITLDPTPLLVEDDTVTLHASALDATGQPIDHPDLKLTWVSTEESVATLEPTGGTDADLVTRSPGTTTLTVSYDQISASTTIEVHNRPVDLVYVAGGGQQGTPGATLPDSLAVRIVDKRGDAVDGVHISFAVTAGGGSLSRTDGTTDASGTLRTAWTLGEAGPQQVRAMASEDQPRVKKMHNSEVVFTAMMEDTTLAVESVTVTPDSAVVETSGTVDLDADVRDASGNSVSSRAVSWASSDTAVVRVDAEGLATAVTEGSVLISATAGGVTGTSDVTVASSSDGTLTIAASADTLYGIGDTLTLSVEARNADGTVIAEPNVQWSSSDPDITTVDTMGTVISRALGTAIIAAAAACCDGGDFVEVAVVDTTSVHTTAPATVTDLSVVAVGENTVTLEWSQVDDGTGNPADYAVRYGSPDLDWGSAYDSEVAVEGTAIGEAASYTVSGLSSGTNYEFGLVSYRGTLGVDATFGNTSNFVTTTTSAGAVGPVDYIVASPSSHTFTQIGDTLRISASARDGLGQTVPDVDFAFSSADPSVASVDSMGLMTAGDLGAAAIIVAAMGTTFTDTVQVQVDTTAPSPIFSDDFESGDASYTSAIGGSWGGWHGNAEGYLGTRASVSSDYARTGTYSMKVDYKAKADLEDNGAPEVPFRLASDPSDAPNEVWIEYWVRVPANYKHRSQSDGADNNKLLALWAENYDGYATEAMFVAEYNRTSDSSSYIRYSVGAGEGENPTPQGMIVRGELFNANKGGTWVRLRFHLRIGDLGGTYAIYDTWKDDTLIGRMPSDWIGAEGEGFDYYRGGYLFGWSNSGWDEQTVFYLDDFKVYDSDPGW